MDWIYDKYTWETSKRLNFDQCLKKVDLRTSDDPTIIIKKVNTDEFVCGGISDYRNRGESLFWRDGISQWDMMKTGTLKLPFPKGKKVQVENVHSVIIIWGKNHIDWGKKQSITLPQGLCYMVPNLEEMEELHFAIQTIYHDSVTCEKKSDMLFYKGSTLLTKVEDISTMREAQEGVYYAQKENGTYTHFIRDVNNMYIIGKSKHTWVDCTAKRLEAIRKMANDIVANAKAEGVYRFYYYSNPSTQGTVLESYLSKHCFPVKIENYFSDDETCNYYVDVDINDINLVAFLKYYGASSFAIYGIELDNYLPYLPYESEDNWYYKSGPQMSFHKKVLSNAVENNSTLTENELMMSLEKLRNRSRDVQEHVQFELFRRLLPDAAEYHNSYYDWAKKEYRAEKDYLLSENKLKSIWKGEFQMYKMAKELYPDAIYQYHCEWLGRQSLDVYIPSISVGIEYQGIQHYEPVEYFGGEKAYVYRTELDNKKRKLCAANHVKLIEWKYDCPLTKNALNRKIKKMASANT